ncbi:unnamed protein product [Paramecium sonneborni]|uniref:Protein kinase domain-containing protein n=1 Tax=Paramecium sonneborni TaxID=65129 RepID=A0A8S1LP13_9CILI|nr:unnamed protein product [Paramecium sonneborni]
MNSDFICFRKHLFKDSIYQIDIQNEQLRLINTSGKPKYIIPLDWSVDISWNLEGQEQAFRLKVNQKFKWFYAKPQTIQYMKKQLQKHVAQRDFNFFYTLTTHQSKGQNGNVYEILKKTDNTANLVAKCIQKDQLDDQNIIFEELNILKLLNHPSLPVFEEFFFTQGTYYIIMEKMQGEKLNTILNTSKILLNLRLIQSIILECLYILQYLESIYVMHRDITLDNILYDQQNKKKSVKLISFSNAARVGTSIKICGTPGYIAPEIFLEQKYGCECDMFSLGCVFYKLLVKKDLFHGNCAIEVLQENKACVINLKTLQLFRIPNSAQDLLGHMLEVNPKLRISVSQALKHPFLNDSLKQTISNQNSQRNFNQNRSERNLLKKDLLSLHTEKQKLEDDLDVDYFKNELPPMSQIPVMNSVKGGQRIKFDGIDDDETKFRTVISKSTG